MPQALAGEIGRSPAELLLAVPTAERSQPAYIGGWTPFGRMVFAYSERELRALHFACPAPPEDHEWVRGGRGARELARAVLLDATSNAMLAERLCRPYTWAVVSRLPNEGFRITKREVLAWVEG